MRSGTTIAIRHGTEGPSWDPYSYSEITVHRGNGVSITIHTGLAMWVEFPAGNPRRVDCFSEEEQTDALNFFTAVTGMTPGEAEDYHQRYRHVCRKCGCRRTRTESGYPGESFNVCAKCGDIVSSNFHLSEIE